MNLICDHVTFGYSRKNPIFRDFCHEFRHGVTLLKGYSGSGKTTLLKILAGYLKVQSGRIVTPSGVKVTSRLYKRREASYMFQGINLLPLVTVERNLRLCAEMAMLPSKEWKPRCEELIQSLGLQELRRRRADQLSGGQAQRAALARTLMKNSDIVLLDEPTSGLDDRNTAIIKRLALHDAGRKICIISTHDARLFDIADEIIDFDSSVSR
ncbi:MAG: ATP-binding cassette domain-containing protein [Akkermansiaceae bacterium]|nr:ATP-binding cassette domain-containing protein [Akkermansiaceae bacterium]